jgi:hypothetical protein
MRLVLPFGSLLAGFLVDDRLGGAFLPETRPSDERSNHVFLS